MVRRIDVGGVSMGDGRRIVLIAGPCVIESEELCLDVAEHVSAIARRLGIGYIFKSSYDKANRMSGASFRGLGMGKGLDVLAAVKAACDVPVLTDVHGVAEAEQATEVVDVLQIPAFLCRQTDLLIAAGKSGRAVNIKKGQFLAPWDLAHSVAKVKSTGNQRIMVTERGAAFGYGNLVVDMRSLVAMRKFGFPVVFDATHSVQLPGAAGGASGGQREYVPALASAAVAVGIDALFVETHPDPAMALCDRETQWPLDDLERLLRMVLRIDDCVKDVGGN
jgi:2-dehydro-3-deoxyphosphooctonate aldolase (KDO 8-P synthase)